MNNELIAFFALLIAFFAFSMFVRGVILYFLDMLDDDDTTK